MHADAHNVYSSTTIVSMGVIGCTYRMVQRPSETIYVNKVMFGFPTRTICLHRLVLFHPSIPAPSVSSRQASLASRDDAAQRRNLWHAWEGLAGDGSISACTVLELGLPLSFLWSSPASTSPMRSLLPAPGRFLASISLW